MTNSTTRRRREKPAKPYADFPLFPHATGRWAKKIRGRFVYFGPWDDPDAALQKYLDQKDDLHAGRTPRSSGDGLTIRDLVNRFLTAKKRAVDAGEITARTFRDYHSAAKRVIGTFGKDRLVVDLRPADFAGLRDVMVRTMSPAGRKTEMAKTRTIFHYAYENELIDRPIKFGSEFKSPSKAVLRRQRQKSRQENGTRMFPAVEIRQMLDAASLPHVRAMILLGVNCGFGNNDIATLPKSALDLENGWIDHPRPKTGVERRCPLWPETVEALRESLAVRPEPKDPADDRLVFLTAYGNPWVRLQGDTWMDSVTIMMREFLTKLGIKRPGVNFYALRHTFETIAGDSRDQVAVNAIMGHADGSMAAECREGIADDRLVAVVSHVRRWLFGPQETE